MTTRVKPRPIELNGGTYEMTIGGSTSPDGYAYIDSSGFMYMAFDSGVSLPITLIVGEELTFKAITPNIGGVSISKHTDFYDGVKTIWSNPQLRVLQDSMETWDGT